MFKIEILMQQPGLLGCGVGWRSQLVWNGGRWALSVGWCVAMAYPKLFAAMLCGQIVANPCYACSRLADARPYISAYQGLWVGGGVAGWQDTWVGAPWGNA